MKLNGCLILTSDSGMMEVGKAVSYSTMISVKIMAPLTEIWMSSGRELLLLMLIPLKVINHLTMLEEKFMSA